MPRSNHIVQPKRHIKGLIVESNETDEVHYQLRHKVDTMPINVVQIDRGERFHSRNQDERSPERSGHSGVSIWNVQFNRTKQRRNTLQSISYRGNLDLAPKFPDTIKHKHLLWGPGCKSLISIISAQEILKFGPKAQATVEGTKGAGYKYLHW